MSIGNKLFWVNRGGIIGHNIREWFLFSSFLLAQKNKLISRALSVCISALLESVSTNALWSSQFVFWFHLHGHNTVFWFHLYGHNTMFSVVINTMCSGSISHGHNTMFWFHLHGHNTCSGSSSIWNMAADASSRVIYLRGICSVSWRAIPLWLPKLPSTSFLYLQQQQQSGEKRCMNFNYIYYTK